MITITITITIWLRAFCVRSQPLGRENGIDLFCGRFLIAPTVKAKPQPTDQQKEIKRPQVGRKGWPMRWIVLFILVYIVVYTYWRLK